MPFRPNFALRCALRAVDEPATSNFALSAPFFRSTVDLLFCVAPDGDTDSVGVWIGKTGSTAAIFESRSI